MENIQQYPRILELPQIQRPQSWNNGVTALIGMRGHSTLATNIGARMAYLERNELFYVSSICYVVTADSDKSSVKNAVPYQCFIRVPQMVKKGVLQQDKIEGPLRKLMVFYQAGREIGYGDKMEEATKDIAKVLPTSQKIINDIKSLKSSYDFNAEVQLRAIAGNGATKLYELVLDHLDRTDPTYSIFILVVDRKRGMARFKSNFAFHELSRNRQKTIVIVRDVSEGNLRDDDYAVLRLIYAMVNKSPFPYAMDPSDIINWFLENGNGYIEVDYRDTQVEVRRAFRELRIPGLRFRRTLMPRNDNESISAAAIEMLESLVALAENDSRGHMYVLYGPVNEIVFDKVHDRARQLGVEITCIPAETPKVYDLDGNLEAFKLYLIRASTGMQSIRCIDRMYGLPHRENTEEIIPRNILQDSFEQDISMKNCLAEVGRVLHAKEDWYRKGGSW
ncbi:MAG: hypothetical protein KGI02_03870 [Thaumarchaeota archaeon]|nr:hypothetical protein [Nitrososphaerota archaeon]MDE1877824.1 hypothetical protein [Nitrososphaerota archaeon]